MQAGMPVDALHSTIRYVLYEIYVSFWHQIGIAVTYEVTDKWRREAPAVARVKDDQSAVPPGMRISAR